MPPQYIGFAEDMMLILFLVCILATLVTVHRATCYRQFQVPPGHHLISPSNCPRRRDVTRLCATSSQLPKTALRPILTPGFLKENMSHCNSKYLGRSYNVCCTKLQYQGGRHGGWRTWGCLQRRLLAKAGENKQHVGSKKANEQTYHCFFSRWARPPRHLTKKLSIGIPSVSLVSRSLQYFRSSKIPSPSILSNSWIFPVSCFVFSRLLCLASSSAFTFISPPGAFDCPPLLITTHLILYLILGKLSWKKNGKKRGTFPLWGPPPPP